MIINTSSLKSKLTFESGDSTLQGVDFDKVFATVVKYSTVRTFFSIWATKDHKFH